MGLISRAFQMESLNFLVTNRIPRRAATRAVGRISRIENESFVRLALWAWKLFAPELDLSEAKRTRYGSLRDFFVRELEPGSRPVDADPDVVVSPCDAVVGECGRIDGDTLIQAKGLDYTLRELLCCEELAKRYENGRFLTLRLKATMYHRFHAPASGRIRQVNYISGDTWNVNPIAVARVERLYCRNERAVLPIECSGGAGGLLTLVPVAAVGVATLRLHCLDRNLDLEYAGPNRLECDARYEKGDELGWFEQGSTIILLAEDGLDLPPHVEQGTTIRVGQTLLNATGMSSPPHRTPPHGTEERSSPFAERQFVRKDMETSR